MVGYDDHQLLSGRSRRRGSGGESECRPGELQSHHGRVVRTNSVPRTPERPAEHFIAVVFGRPNFIEVAFARFKLVNGASCSIVYSHRIYGEKIGDQMSAWLNANAPATEEALMQWSEAPAPEALSR